MGAAGAAGALVSCADQERTAGTATAREADGEHLVATTLPLDEQQATLGGGAFSLFSQTDLDFQTLFALGSAGLITVAGEVASVVAQVNATPGGPTYQSIYDGFVAMGNRLQAKAVQSLDKGHRVTARSELLRAAKYYAQALYWVLGTATPDAEKATYTALDDSFRAALALMEPAPEALEVSYGSHRLPAWLLRPSDDGTARPTIIMNNGSDGQHVDLLVQGGYAALERGYNVVIFEGPGQGSMLFVHNVPFTHEWQEVITPIVDVLVERSDVDAERIALRGISFGGLLCPWAAAHEHRLAALVADPGSTSSWLDYPEVVRNTAESDDPEEVNRLWREMIIPASTPEQLFALKKTLEIFSSEAHDEVMAGGYPTDWFSLSRTIQDYDLSGVAERIECPTLVTLYEGDTAFKDEPRKLFEMLRTEHRELVEFTSVDGAQYHCGPMAPQISNEACWDWLDETFGR